MRYRSYGQKHNNNARPIASARLSKIKSSTAPQLTLDKVRRRLTRESHLLAGWKFTTSNGRKQMSYADRDKYGIYKSSSGPGPALMGADTLIGDSVVNGQEENLGDIKEIMLDMRSGQVAYAVLSFGGFLGMGEKLFAVPWQALHLDTVNKRFVLDVDKQRLSSAPGFDPDRWPDMSDVGWVNHNYELNPMDAQPYQFEAWTH